ncbi:hypothetical protein QBC46DRAFT_407307 [Diplogelasinospora grovesii]|uniref:Uncharacterized protein n=1 Tax=Diplogelasinospora grovesii TaxID=303347 RepID=A0AAN6NAY1_9PEZI|nr:hypothetical protein QBC46DRAFT_407307 [Diplogelasinospora grovesii]
MLIEPGSVQAVHSLNSGFLFAVLIATIFAASSSSVHLIEVYIMLQICFGYFVTTMSVFGLRFQLLGPNRVMELFTSFRSSVKHFKGQPTGSRAVERENEARKSPFSQKILKKVLACSKPAATPQNAEVQLLSLSFLKPPHLAWSGVLWRSGIACALAGFNVYFWFNGLAQLSPENKCTPRVFMFSNQLLSGRLVDFFTVMSIITVAMTGLPTLHLIITLHYLAVFVIMSIYKYTLY